MDTHEALEEHDKIIIDNLSDVDESVLTETEKIINSKEFKKSWRREVRISRNARIMFAVKKWLAKNYLALLSIVISVAAFIKSFF